MTPIDRRGVDAIGEVNVNPIDAEFAHPGIRPGLAQDVHGRIVGYWSAVMVGWM